jgi:hypothetical protein
MLAAVSSDVMLAVRTERLRRCQGDVDHLTMKWLWMFDASNTGPPNQNQKRGGGSH